MIGAVEQRCLEGNDREASQHARFGRRLQPLLDTGPLFLRHRAANHRILEDKTGTWRQWFEAQLDASKLASTAGLLLMCIVDLGIAGDRLAISDLRCADIGVDLELALHAVDDDLEVQFAHPLDHGLAALMIDGAPDRRILRRETSQRATHLLLVAVAP